MNKKGKKASRAFERLVWNGVDDLAARVVQRSDGNHLRERDRRIAECTELSGVPGVDHALEVEAKAGRPLPPQIDEKRRPVAHAHLLRPFCRRGEWFRAEVVGWPLDHRSHHARDTDVLEIEHEI